jgi:hypothetical protein
MTKRIVRVVLSGDKGAEQKSRNLHLKFFGPAIPMGSPKQKLGRIAPHVAVWHF